MQPAGRWFNFGFLFQLSVWVDSLGCRGRWLMIKKLPEWAAFLTVLSVPFLLSPDPCVHLENYTLFQWFCVRRFYSSSFSDNGHIAHYLDTIFWEEKLVLELGCDFFFSFFILEAKSVTWSWVWWINWKYLIFGFKEVAIKKNFCSLALKCPPEWYCSWWSCWWMMCWY